MTSTLTQTPLFDWHVSRGAKMVDFAGWSMPVQYTSIIAEHNATRQGVGLFDISHMGRLLFTYADAAQFVDSLLTRKIVHLPLGKIRYGLITNEQGGILDDVLVYHLTRFGDIRGPCYLMVVNAGNREKIVAWIESHLAGSDVQFMDRTASTVMIAVQGPRAIGLLDPLVDADLAGMKYYTGSQASIGGKWCILSRTGYTGEDGCELIVAADDALAVWELLMDAGQAADITPAGLGCRDTLRLEAAMPLYGHELSEEINPMQAGLGFAVNTKAHQFIGREAILQFQQDENLPRRIGLELSGRRVPRQHYPILFGGEVVGEVTSGTFSPTFEKPIAMGYVRPDCAELGTELAVDIRGRQEPARVVKLPFYSRPS